MRARTEGSVKVWPRAEPETEWFPMRTSCQQSLIYQYSLFVICSLPILNWVYVLWEGVCRINESCKCLGVRRNVACKGPACIGMLASEFPVNPRNHLMVQTHK